MCHCDYLQAVVLAPRPTISIPLTNISPALLEELTNELSTLASVYHKPVEAFIGRGRLGADELARKGIQATSVPGLLGSSTNGVAGLDTVEGATSALQKVAQGQRSENLLDFGDDDEDDPNRNSLAPSGLGAIVAQQAKVPSSSSGGMQQQSRAAPANPMDDLMGLFDSAGLGPGATQAQPQAAPQLFGASPFGQQQQQSQWQQQAKPKSDMDLMGDLF
jgi:hypothetical protein